MSFELTVVIARAKSDTKVVHPFPFACEHRPLIFILHLCNHRKRWRKPINGMASNLCLSGPIMPFTVYPYSVQ